MAAGLTAGSSASSPNASELVATICGDDTYCSLSPEMQLHERTYLAVHVATQIQARILVNAVKAGEFAWNTASTEDHQRLMRSRDIPDMNGAWAGSVPLVLVAAPAPWMAPAGNVVVINPATDETLVETLVAVGWLERGV